LLLFSITKIQLVLEPRWVDEYSIRSKNYLES